MATKAMTMDELLKSDSTLKLEMGQTVEGKILSVKKHEIWVDIGGNGLGLVIRREVGHGTNLEEDAIVTATVIDPELDEGYALLSLRRAAKEKGWEELDKLQKSGEVIEIKAYDANRGGLLVELEGVRGFLPVSQLSPAHYPRVSGADKDEILSKLNALIKETLKVKVLDVDKSDNKLIVSEKEATREDMKNKFADLEVGKIAKCKITGVVDFGAFVSVDGIEGLIHISEISWDRVDDPAKYLKVGDEVDAKIIAIDKERLSLSIKQTKEDPWQEEVKEFKKGTEVEGSVTRITPFGAFIQITPAVEALVHISELGDGSESDPESVFKLNETKTFSIIDIDRDSRKISLRLKK